MKVLLFGMVINIANKIFASRIKPFIFYLEPLQVKNPEMSLNVEQFMEFSGKK